MKLIRNFEINTNDLSTLQESRSFKVSGDDGATFSLQVKTAAGKFYNFKSREFETTITSEHRLKNQTITGTSYTGHLFFPADTDGETYTILLFAEPHFDTELIDGLTGNLNGVELEHNPVLYQTDITQVANIVLTIGPVAATTANYTSASLANKLQLTQSPTIKTPVTGSISWTIANNTTDAVAFGLISQVALRDIDGSIECDVKDSAWRADAAFTIDDTTSTGGSTHTTYTVDDISDLEIGMTVVGQSTTLSRVFTAPYNADNPEIRNKPRIKLASAKALADNTTLVARGYGINAINKALGIDIVFSNFKLIQTPLTTTVRGAIEDSTTVSVNGTYGISKGAYIEGFGVNNATNNPLTAVSISSSAGSLTTTVAQTLTANTTLNIIGSSNSYTITGDITVNKFPTASKAVYLDLDQILTLGTAS
jgi:hypothetical protein